MVSVNQKGVRDYIRPVDIAVLTTIDLQYGDAFDNIPIGELRKRGIWKVASCDRQHRSKGYCSAHYRRFRLHGNPRADIAIRAYVRIPAHNKVGIGK